MAIQAEMSGSNLPSAAKASAQESKEETAMMDLIRHVNEVLGEGMNEIIGMTGVMTIIEMGQAEGRDEGTTTDTKIAKEMSDGRRVVKIVKGMADGRRAAARKATDVRHGTTEVTEETTDTVTDGTAEVRTHGLLVLPSPAAEGNGAATHTRAKDAPTSSHLPRYQLLKVTDKINPRRPPTGTAGQKVVLRANFFRMDLNIEKLQGMIFHHFDVTILTRPNDDKRGKDCPPRINRVAFQQLQLDLKASAPELRQVVFDGRKNLYAPFVLREELLGVPFPVSITDEDKQQVDYVVTIQASNAETTLPNVILEYIRGKAKANEAETFFRTDHREPLRVFDILMKTAALKDQRPLVDAVAAFFGSSDITRVNPKNFNKGSREFQKLQRYLKDVCVMATHRNKGRRRYKIKGLSEFGANRTTFIYEEGGDRKEISVAEYFEHYLQKRIEFPQLPLVVAGTTKHIFLPMECLRIKAGQRHIGSLNDKQTGDIIKLAAMQPYNRERYIHEGRSLLHKAEDEEFYKKWGVSLSKNMEEIEGRILPSPVLMGQSGGAIDPQNGAFDFGKIRNRFYEPASLTSYAIVIVGPMVSNVSNRDVVRFMEQVFRACRDKGMNVVSPSNWDDVIVRQDRRSVLDTLQAAQQRAEFAFGIPSQIVFGVLTSKEIYLDVKLAAESQLNLMTQCFQDRHFRNSKPGVNMNLALKINTKLGGINVKLARPEFNRQNTGEIWRKGTMVLGIDVSHPAGRADGAKSIAAAVASMDDEFCTYRTEVMSTPARQEVINGVGVLMKPLLEKYKAANNGQIPERIVCYRDGVSEGQFQEVVLQEVQSLRRTLLEMKAESIGLTFLVVNKRHGARFFPKNPRDGDRKGNLMAGTVIDSGVTHPFEYDFYLNSHQGLQGTSRASHYHVLYDDNEFTVDELQEFTYKTCYLYASATRSVSVVPAIYYADLVSIRTRCYRFGNNDDTSMAGSANSIESRYGEPTDIMRNTMFFC
ncbi:Protein argonaute 10 [Phlyctochytrium planicorne]|nr:Protein argonaute 10 [Phlyctochytrium planicorne]